MRAAIRSCSPHRRANSGNRAGWMPESWGPMLFRSSFQACALILLLAFAAFAQVSASISGKVEDATGAPIEGASVTVKSIETGAVRTVKTDAAGSFRVPGLGLGSQEVKAEKTGFKAALRTGVNL